MKYLFTFRERTFGSFADYEAAQERVLTLFQKWQMPASLTIHQFLARVGEFGGCIVCETEDPSDLHRLAIVFAVYECKLEPVMDIMQAVPIELEAMSWRKANSA